jgi:hypothetical protein
MYSNKIKLFILNNLNSIKFQQNFLDTGFLFLFVVFCLLTLPFIFSGNRSYDYDHLHYHLPSILQIRNKFPNLNLSTDTLSAISPGYYYFLAFISLIVGENELNLRLTNCLVSFLVIACLYNYSRRKLPIKISCLLILPLLTSNFFLKSSWWIFTDNAALLFITLTIIEILRSNATVKQGIKIGFLSGFTVFIRQMNAWLFFPLICRFLLIIKKNTYIKNLIVFIFSLSPILVIGLLYLSWGGLVPPVWREASIKTSFAPLAYLLSVFGVLGVFYLFLFIKKELFNSSLKLLPVSILIGLIVSLIGPTSYSLEQGRWGGYLWEVIKYLPVLHDRSIFLMITTPLGVYTVSIFALKLKEKRKSQDFLLWLCLVTSWSISFIINRQVFHRYYEPVILVFLIIACVKILGDVENKNPYDFYSSLILLVLFQFSFSLKLIL